jgi:predicted dinucleotide-binding enzyme
LPFSVRPAEKIKIGIIGSGNVGSAIGAVWVEAGHDVMFSSRHIEHDRSLAERLGAGARAGTPREAAAFGDVLMVSVPYHALPDVGEEIADLIEDKVVIDTCNPFPGRDGEIAKWAREKGAGLASAELLPGAHVVRAFNAVGAERMG